MSVQTGDILANDRKPPGTACRNHVRSTTTTSNTPSDRLGVQAAPMAMEIISVFLLSSSYSDVKES